MIAGLDGPLGWGQGPAQTELLPVGCPRRMAVFGLDLVGGGCHRARVLRGGYSNTGTQLGLPQFMMERVGGEEGRVWDPAKREATEKWVNHQGHQWKHGSNDGAPWGNEKGKTAGHQRKDGGE